MIDADFPNDGVAMLDAHGWEERSMATRSEGPAQGSSRPNRLRPFQVEVPYPRGHGARVSLPPRIFSIAGIDSLQRIGVK